MRPYFMIGLLWLLFSCNNTDTMRQTGSAIVFIGTYTRTEGHVDGKGAGIYLFEQDSLSGKLDSTGVAVGLVNPSFLALGKNGQWLYAVEEIGPDVDTTGYVAAYAWQNGQLQFINRQPSHSFAPCHLIADRQGRYVFVANYVGGVVAMYPIRADGGLLPASHIVQLEGQGPHPRQEASHPHSVNLSPDERYLYVPDLGTDRIQIYRIDYEQGKLLSAKPSFVQLQGGAGPRHMSFHPKLPYAYVLNELNNSVTTLLWQKDSGALVAQQHYATLPDGFEEFNLCSHIQVTPDGRFLYAANRGHNSLVGYHIDQATGALQRIGHTSTQGDFPRHFTISPDGRFLYAANQNTDNLLIFSIEQDGNLSPRHELHMRTPVCIVFGN